MIPRTIFSTSLLPHNPFWVLEDERPVLGQVNALPEANLRSGARAARLGYKDVIIGHETKGECPNKVTVFRFKSREVIGELNVDLHDVKSKMLKLASDSEVIILDFDGVRQLDSEALGIFINGLRKEGKQIIFCNVGQFISGQLKVTKLNTVIKTYPTEAEALSALGVEN